MRYAIYLFLILAVIANLVIGDQSRIHGKHFWQEDILDPKKYLENIYEYYVADDKSNLTRWFFSSEHIQSPSRRPTYIFQNQARSQLFKKSPQIYESLEGIPVDFYNKEDDKLDPYYQLHIQEEKLVSENPKKISKEALWLNIRRVFSQPNPVKGNEKVGTYLYRKMGRSGLILYLQTFRYKSLKENGNFQKSSGVNLIGILPGSQWGTSKDKVLIIGTNWDIQGDKAGDHGSGLAALLEISRVLMADKNYKPEFSVIFVAFDAKNDGCAGSKKFVSEYLQPFIIKEHGSTIQGMFNIETIFSFSHRNFTQMLPKFYYESNPEVYNEIMKNGGKGNFLAVIGRGTSEESRLSNTLQKHMQSEGILQQDFVFPSLNGSAKIINYLAKYSEIWNSNSGRFWFPDKANSLASVTVTDTGVYRRVLSNCRSKQCKTQQKRRNFLKRILFLESVTKSLVKTVKELSMPSKIETKISSEVKLKENLRLYEILSRFLSSLTNWQYRIENKISELIKHYKHGSDLNTDTINLVYQIKNQDQDEPEENISNSPYFVLGDKSTNIPVLNNVIENYYGHKKENISSKNSPMIVKIVT